MRRRGADACARPSDERGTVTAFVTVVSLALLVAGGLVVDGSLILAARREAADVAKAAARAGAQAVDETSIRGGRRPRPRVDASRRAQAFLTAVGHRGSAVVRGDRITVTVSISRNLQVLPIVGMRTMTVSETSHARIVRGVTRGET
ncbi:MAG TPA: pilus assembly protein TadG-related protein [Acidimicrobiia bacterium]|nr:pilus assembly protein TadG-related protein [Acidimicrobiia bacterium]